MQKRNLSIPPPPPPDVAVAVAEDGEEEPEIGCFSSSEDMVLLLRLVSGGFTDPLGWCRRAAEGGRGISATVIV